MKYLYVALFITVYTNFCLVAGDDPEFSPAMIECLKENGLDLELLKKMFEENDGSVIEQTKCLSFCMMEKTNLLDDSKHIKVEEYKKQISLLKNPEQVKKLEKVEEKCPDIHSEMNCDKARSLDKCIAAM